MTTNTPTPAEELRAEFETWVKRERKLEPDSYQIERMGDGYYYDWTDAAWDGWKAARASTPTEKEAGDEELRDILGKLAIEAHLARSITEDKKIITWGAGVDWVPVAIQAMKEAISRARSASVTDDRVSIPVEEFAAEIEAKHPELMAEARKDVRAWLHPTPPAHGEGELREALRPFAELADSYSDDYPDTLKLEYVDEGNRDEDCPTFSFTLGDLRRAASALSHAPSPPQKDWSGVVEAAERVNKLAVQKAQMTCREHGTGSPQLYRDFMQDADRKLDEAFQAHYEALASTSKASTTHKQKRKRDG